MNIFKIKSRSNASGEGLAVVIIIVLLLGAGAWYLFSAKRSSEKEGRNFANEVVQRVAVQHDLTFLQSSMGPAAKIEFPPSNQRNLIETLTQLGVPAQPIKVEGKIMFTSQFFKPQGFFTAQLNYPARPGSLEFSFSHPVGRWQIDSIQLSLERAR